MNNKDLPPVIGHRGAASLAPENTIAAIMAATGAGAAWIETDVKLTRDGVPILFHDEMLNRTTNAQGPVMQRDWAELSQLDAGSWKSRRFAGEKIPSLAQAVSVILNHRLCVNFEIKPCPGREVETARRILAELRQLWPAAGMAPPFISSFSLAALEIARDMAPDWPRGLLFDRAPRQWRLIADLLMPTTLNLNARRLTEKNLRSFAAYGLPVMAYTVNSRMRAQWLWRHGVTSIFSDDPGKLLEAARRGKMKG